MDVDKANRAGIGKNRQHPLHHSRFQGPFGTAGISYRRLIGAVALCCRSEPKQEPQGYTLAEILADKPQQGYTINLN